MKYVILLLSCSILLSQNDTTFIRDYYHFDLNEFKSVEIDLDFGLGELDVNAHNKSKTISGKLEYNPDHTEVDVEFTSNNSKAFLSIEGESGDKFDCCDNGISFDDFDFGDDFHNYMDLNLARDIPTELELDFGLGEATLDLTHIDLTYFELDCGLSDVKVTMDQSNNIGCERVSISSGLGDFNGYGLGNLNSERFNLDVGLGSATVDLRGKFDEDMDLSIDVGLGSLELIIPENVNVKIRVDHSFLSSVDVDGLVSEGNNKYVSRDWDNSRPTIDGHISVGIGSVDVEVD